MRKILTLLILIFSFSCIKSPHEIGWYLTIRLPGKLKKTTLRKELEKSEKFKIAYDSIFNIQQNIHFNLSNTSVPDTLLSDSLRKFLPTLIDTTLSKFGSILFLVYSGAEYKGNITTTPFVIKTEIQAFTWDEINNILVLESVKTKTDTINSTGTFNLTHRLSFNDFPAGPHLFIIKPIVESGTCSFDTIKTFKEVFLGASVLGDNVVTFVDTIKNENEDLRNAAQENRIKRIFLHANVKHSFPVGVWFNFYLISKLNDTFKIIDSLHIVPAPKNAQGVSIDSTTFSVDIDITKDLIDLAKDSLIFYRAEIIADSQGPAYLKPEDFVSVKGYIGVTIYALEK